MNYKNINNTILAWVYGDIYLSLYQQISCNFLQGIF